MFAFNNVYLICHILLYSIIALAATTLTVANPSTNSFTPNTPVTITFNLVVTESNGQDGSLTAIDLYFTNNAQYETAGIVKSTAFRATQPAAGTSTMLHPGPGTTIATSEATLTPDATNCIHYTHLCAVIIVAADPGSTTDDDDVCVELTTTGAGQISCTALAATALTVANPSTNSFTPNTPVTITFDLVVTESNGQAGSLTAIDLYFTNNAQYETAGIVKSAAFSSTQPAAGTPTVLTASSRTTISTSEATLTPDGTNCIQYTHLCAVIIVAADPGSSTDDDDVCVALTTTTAGQVACTALAATTLTVANPSTNSFKPNSPVTITFDLVVTESNGQAGSLTAIDLYFTNNAQYETAGIVKSAAFRATQPAAGNPTVLTASSGTTISTSEATLTPDATNCIQYTHLCAVIIVAADPGSSTDDDDVCDELTTTGAGRVMCTDIATGILDITLPTTLTSGICNSVASVTFDLKLCELNGIDGTVTAVKAYYTDNSNFEAASISSTAVSVTLSGGTTIAVSANGAAVTTGATVNLPDETSNCASYSHICAVVTVTGDSTTSNQDSCIAINGGTTSTTNCPDITPPIVTCPADKTVEYDKGGTTAVVTFTGESATDDSGSTPTVSCSPASGATFSSGTTTVTCSATDDSNNTGTCTFTVTVQDTTPPSVTCPRDQVKKYDAGGTTAIVTFTGESATDNDGTSPAVTCNPSSSSTFNSGITVVTCTASDAAGNSNSCTFNVTVQATVTCTDNPCDPTTEYCVDKGQDYQCNCKSGYRKQNGVCIAIKAFKCGCTISNHNGQTATFTSVLNNPTSSQHKSLKSGTITMVNTLMNGLSSTYVQSSHVAFSSGSVKAEFISTFTAESDVTATDIADYSNLEASNNGPAFDNITADSFTAEGFTDSVCTIPDRHDCSVNAQCLDTTDGSFNCTCNSGFEDESYDITNRPGRNCTDINECATANGMCAHTCINNVGSFTCSCNTGYTLNTDGLACDDIDECATANGGCAVTCTNTVGSFTCSCNSGYTLNADGLTCDDTTPPTVTCPQDQVSEYDNGGTTAVVTFTGESATDNDGTSPTVTCTPASGSVFNSGATIVACSATDAAGNVGSCTFTVTVQDTTPPTVTCPKNQLVAYDAKSTTAMVTYAGESATDNDGTSPAVTCLPASGSTFNSGTTTVTCSATDAAGNAGSCTFTVTVQATVTCSDDPCDATTEYCKDNPQGYQCKCISGYRKQNGVCIPIKAFKVRCTVTTINGQQATYTSALTDPNSSQYQTNQNAVVNMANTLMTGVGNSYVQTTVTTFSSGSVVVEFVSTFTAQTDVTSTMISEHCNTEAANAGPAFDDITAEGFTAEDFTDAICVIPLGNDCSGNAQCLDTADGSFNCVCKNGFEDKSQDIVKRPGRLCSDTIPPDLTCPGNQVVEYDDGSTTAVVIFSGQSAIDNTGTTPSVACSPSSGDTFSSGANTVTCTATDASNNQGTCTFTVTVQDTTPPGVTCPADLALVSVLRTMNVPFSVEPATDNSGTVPEVTCNPSSGSTFNVGSTTVTCTATDAAGNEDTCTFTVAVEELNECDNNPCQHGSCTDGINSYTCTCEDGYDGKDCHININDCADNPCQNGATCNDLVNAFECDCLPGYTGDVCETGTIQCIKTCTEGSCTVQDGEQVCKCNSGFILSDPDIDDFCEDINECVGVSPCSDNGICINTPGSYICRCLPGYELLSDGNTCENIDDCVNNMCDHGLCKDVVNDYECICDPGYEGEHCDEDIDDCWNYPCENGHCEDGINMFSCTCFDGYTGALCDGDINECESEPCQNGGYCIDLIDKYECYCAYGWQGVNCEEDIDECVVLAHRTTLCHHTCNNVDVNTASRGYICACNDGYVLESNGRSCSDINECTESTDDCDLNADCTNTYGGYLCQCIDGYNGDGKTCFDINECVEGTDECDPNAECTNTIGSYTCQCNDGYRGEGKKCYEIILMEFGTEVNDKQLRETSESNLQSARDLISPTFKPAVGFPFFGDFYYSLYFTDNGVIVLMNENDVKLAYAHPFKTGFTTSHQIPMIAVFWEDVDMTDTDIGEVFYQEYDIDTGDSEVFNEVNSKIADYASSTSDSQAQGFSATWILKVTWLEVAAFSVNYTKEWTNTFQAILATDGIYGFVILNYKEDQMLWNTDMRTENNAIYGYNNGRGTVENLQSGSSSPEDRYRPDQRNGNTGLKGRWVLRVEDNNEFTVNHKKRCLDWYVVQPDPSTWNEGLGGCPCGFEQGQNDNSFGRGSSIVTGQANRAITDEEANSGLTAEVQAGISIRRGSSFTLQSANANRFGAGQQCAYRSDHSLVDGYEQDIWSSSFQERTYYTFRGWWFFDYYRYLMWLADDLMPRYSCCAMSNDPAFCDLYKEKRPVGQCSDYTPPRIGWMFGDPHLKTLDGVDYTFNGLGEYILVDVDIGDFILQGRTGLATYDNGSETSATEFTAFVAKQQNSSTIQIMVQTSLSGFVILVDGEEFNNTYLSEDFTDLGLYNVKLRQKYTSEKSEPRIIALFSSGISISVGVVENSTMLDVLFSAPESYKGKTRGLFGIWNDDVTDDFTMYDGTLKTPSIPGAELTEREQFEFGQTWMVTAEQSLFSYLDDESWSTYNDPEFVPYFLDELISRFNSSDKEFLDTATTTCGDNTQCLYDTLATRATRIGKAAKLSSAEFQDGEEKLINYPPIINGTQVIQVTTDQSYTIEYTATDLNNDAITFSLANDIPGASIDANTGVLNWTPSTTDFVDLGIVATDGKAISQIKPIVQLCKCENGGTCNFGSRVNGSDEVNSKFKVVTCDCPPAYSGDFCDNDYDACQDDPCYHDVTCTDLPAPKTGYECGDCPSGLTGDGEKCFDVDECIDGKDQDPSMDFCQQECVNNEGSYECTCFEGYTKLNRTHCKDIDECEIGNFTCTANSLCSNTQGSYDCVCDPGYTETTNGTCININECEAEFGICPNTSYCADTDGSFACVCLDGYETDQCTDINECAVTHGNDCSDKATCENTKGSYECKCNNGWQGNGTHCDDVDECNDLNLNTCDRQKATCTNTDGNYTCQCNDGFIGTGQIDGCQNINECTTNAHNCLSAGSQCEDLIGSFKCVCEDGYEDVNGNGTNCVDIDECSLDSTVCPDNSYCENSVGSWQCDCNRGYLKDENNICQDINECQSADENDCDLSISHCVNTEGNFTCNCKIGFTGNGRSCSDVDECSVSSGGCEQSCTNTEGNYFCGCNEGYNLAVDGLHCTDINECDVGTHNCPQACTNVDRTVNSDGFTCACSEGFTDSGSDGRNCVPNQDCTTLTCTHGTCYVLSGVQQCQCDQGYSLDPSDSTNCLAIDECADESDLCDHNCQDETPGYTCSCRDGYNLGNDQRSCIDINECTTGDHNCTVLEKCVNKEGTFKCVCLSGFGGSGDGCQDVDECAVNGTCHANAICTNTIGSYTCECSVGFVGNGFTCTDKNECDEGLCHTDATCTNTIGSYSCVCKDGYTGDGADCTDIDECTTDDSRYDHRCSSTANCINTPGSYECKCSDGFVGNGYEDCLDLNECLNDPCDSGAECHNTEGSYICLCKNGYVSVDDTCRDIDECANSPCKMKEQCVNVPGSYQCTCAPGYYKDGQTCKEAESFTLTLTVTSIGTMDLTQENADLLDPSSTTYQSVTTAIVDDINDVLSDSTNYIGATVQKFEFSSDGTVATCVLNYSDKSGETASDIITALKDGLAQIEFVDDSIEVSGTDINHCIAGTHNCKQNENCVFTKNDEFTCECAEGYEANRAGACKNVDECGSDTPPCHATLENCLDTDGGYTCSCITGYFKQNGVCQATKSFKGQFKVTNKEYTNDLNDPLSQKYLEFTTYFIEAMRIVYTSNPITRPFYRGCDILDLRPGSIDVELELHFDEEAEIKSSTLESIPHEDYAGTIDVTDDYIIGFNSNADDEIEFQVNTDTACSRTSTNDCHENATCIDVGGHFHCVCKTGFTDIGGRPGRLCEKEGDPAQEKQTEEKTDLFLIMTITLCITGFILFVGILICVMFCCRRNIGKRPSKLMKNESYWNTFYRSREPSNDWDDNASNLDDAHSSEDPDERMRHLATVMERAPRIAEFKIQRPDLYHSKQSKQFIRPFVAQGTEERDAHMQMATDRRYDAASGDQASFSDFTMNRQGRHGLMDQQRSIQEHIRH
ncbi:uncharacterized protein LOC144449999 [Glandiceps talaboti]